MGVIFVVVSVAMAILLCVHDVGGCFIFVPVIHDRDRFNEETGLCSHISTATRQCVSPSIV